MKVGVGYCLPGISFKEGQWKSTECMPPVPPWGGHQLNERQVGLCLDLSMPSKGLFTFQHSWPERGCGGREQSSCPGRKPHLENDKESHHQHVFPGFPWRETKEMTLLPVKMLCY